MPRGQISGHRALAHLLAAHSSATPKQAKEPILAIATTLNNDMTKTGFLILLLIDFAAMAQSGEEIFLRGIARSSRQDYAGAIVDFTKAIELDQRFAIASYLNRGQAKMNLKDYRGAIADFTKIVEIETRKDNLSVAHKFRADVYYEQKKYKEALADYTKALENDKTNESAYFNRGNVKHDTDDFTGAISDFTKVIELKGDFAMAYMNRGLCKLKSEQQDSGCLDFSKAGELGFTQAYDMIRDYCN